MPLASETTGSTTSQFAWDTTGDNPVLLTDGATSYIYGPDDEPIEQIAADGTVSYLHHDQLGSTRLITNASGDVVGSFTYNPYGVLESSTGTVTTGLGYAAEYTDPATGFEYDQARYYDPSTGQFMTQDPAEEDTDQPYDYANDNPLSATDPSGESPCSVIAVWDGDGLLFSDGETCPQPTVGGATAAALALIGAAALDVAEQCLKNSRCNSNDYKNPLQEHHIVAQTARRAQPARNVLAAVHLGINSSPNLVLLSAGFHQRLHTTAYYDSVNDAVEAAAPYGYTGVASTLRSIASVLTAADPNLFSA